MYKLIESYDANGDLSKEWFVKFQFLIPDQLKTSDSGQWQRFKVGNSINCLHTKTDRWRQLKVVKKGIKTLLDNGFNPYVEFDLKSKVTYSGHTIINCVEKYYQEIAADVEPSTLRKYKTYLNLFTHHLSENNKDYLQISQADKAIVYSFIKYYQSKKKWSNKTYNHYLNSISTFFEHFKNNYDDLVLKNPCDSLKRLRPAKKGNRPFDNHEFKTTLEHLRKFSPNLHRFCKFMYYSCFRPDAECRLVKISDIDLQSRRIRIGDDITKGNATQVIPIDDEFAEFIESMNLHQYPRNYYVFGKGGNPGETPAHAKYYGKHFAPIKKLLGLHKDVTLYAFKHTRAIHMVEVGELLHNIIKFTRHKTLANLMDYLKDMGVIIGETTKFKSRRI